jgi:hypothetical protein
MLLTYSFIRRCSVCTREKRKNKKEKEKGYFASFIRRCSVYTKDISDRDLIYILMYEEEDTCMSYEKEDRYSITISSAILTPSEEKKKRCGAPVRNRRGGY